MGQRTSGLHMLGIEDIRSWQYIPADMPEVYRYNSSDKSKLHARLFHDTRCMAHMVMDDRGS